VRTKLQHTFGDEYVFSVESLPGHGTTVFIEMPAKESDIL
jgi:sensor histidine kinase YesM